MSSGTDKRGKLVMRTGEGDVDINGILADMDRRIGLISSESGDLLHQVEEELGQSPSAGKLYTKDNKAVDLKRNDGKKQNNNNNRLKNARVDNRNNVRTDLSNPRAAAAASNAVDSEEESGGEDEVLLSHQLNKGEFSDNIKKLVDNLSKNVDEIKKRYVQIDNSLTEITHERQVFLDKIENLEEDNMILNMTIQKGLVAQKRGKFAGVRAANKEGAKRGDELRKALMEEEEQVVQFGDMADIYHSTSLYSRIMTRILQNLPFRQDIQEITAKHGTSVSTYFVFLRYAFMQFTLIGFIMLGFIAVHCFLMYIRGDNFFNSVKEQSSEIPKFLLYHSFAPQEALLYIGMVIVAFVVLGFTIVEKLLREDRLGKEIAVVEEEGQHTFSKEIFGAWDLSLTSQADVEGMNGAIADVLLQNVTEVRRKGFKTKRTFRQSAYIYYLRVLGFLLYLLWQFFAFLVIIFLTIYNQVMVEAIPLVGPSLSAYSNIIANYSLNFLEFLSPIVLGYITEMEKWDSPQVEVSVKLFRLFLSNQLNVLLFVLQYLMLADAYLLAQNSYFTLMRGNIANNYYPNKFNCRLDQVEYLTLQLAITNTIGNVIFPLMIGYGRHLYYYLFPNATKRPKEEFDIVESMVGLLNTTMIEMLRIPFAPQTLILSPIFLYINFKIEKFVVLNFNNKPKRPWKAEKAGLVFTGFYMMAFVMICVPVVCYFFYSKTFPKDCDIQDKHIGVCDPVSDGTECVGSGSFTTAFGDSTCNSAGVSAAYPTCICSTSCGPFVESASNIQPLQVLIHAYYALEVVFLIFVESSFGAWLLVCVVAYLASTRKNSINVIRWSFESKERTLEAQIISLEAEKKRNERLIAKLKSLD